MIRSNRIVYKVDMHRNSRTKSGQQHGQRTLFERNRLQKWLTAKEDEHLEFKEAKANFHFEKLVKSPGGFPTGITPDNIIDKQFPRNRRIAETFLRCGLVERAGQGANRMLVEAVRDSKPLPDYTRSDAQEVFVTSHGEMQDPAFILFLGKLETERGIPFSSHKSAATPTAANVR
jgi:Putative ATP-dependent DNA helicase recG C-terminal